MISIRHREELHLRAVVIPTQVYAILWRSSFVYTSALIRRSPNSAPHGTHDYQSHSARPYKQRKTPTSEHSGVISLRTLILAPPRGDDIYISFSYYFCMIFFNPHRNLRLSPDYRNSCIKKSEPPDWEAPKRFGLTTKSLITYNQLQLLEAVHQH